MKAEELFNEAHWTTKASRFAGKVIDRFRPASERFSPERRGVGAAKAKEDWATGHEQELRLRQGRILVNIGKKGWYVTRKQAEELIAQLEQALL